MVNVRPFLQSRAPGTLVEDELKNPARTEITDQAAAAGIRLDLGAVLPESTTSAQQLLLFAQEEAEIADGLGGPEALQLRFAESIMRALFELGGNIESPEVLIGVAQDLQISGESAASALRDDVLRTRVQEAFEMGLYLGVTTPPVFILEDSFVVEGPQTNESFQNILRAVWTQRGGDKEDSQ